MNWFGWKWYIFAFSDFIIYVYVCLFYSRRYSNMSYSVLCILAMLLKFSISDLVGDRDSHTRKDMIWYDTCGLQEANALKISKSKYSLWRVASELKSITSDNINALKFKPSHWKDVPRNTYVFNKKNYIYFTCILYA